jgi:hypothetical protein
MRCSSPRVATSVLALAAVSLLAAGCGGGSSRSTTAATSTARTTLAFAHCMRAHGVPGFPDPDSTGEIPKRQIERLGISKSQMRAAEMPCDHLIASGGLGPQQTPQQTRTRLADALAFARCVRARGFPSFPDPTNQGQLTPEMVTAAGIDLHQRKLLDAGLACVAVTHGLLTPAAIERAVNGG